MARRGSFSSTGSLDPFGGARGGLGRYNITGESITSLASYETYAVQVAWANGNATDEQYLAQLQKMVDLAVPGTREFVTASNQLHDAQYSIGRNALVRDVNNATDHPSRTASLTALLAYEQRNLGTMTSTDSQAYRDEIDKIASLRGELRKERYTKLLEDVNNGKASTSALRTLAQNLLSEATTSHDPDTDEWGSTIDQLTQRLKDEHTAKQYQDYQHQRITGADLLGTLDASLAEMTPGSPAFLELTRQREDLATQVKNDTQNKTEANIASQRAAGKISDEQYLVYLRDAYVNTDPGTAEWTRAGGRLAEYTYSLAEDKLRFDVSKGKRPVGDLVKFYQGYLKTMDPGSEKWRTVSAAITSLQGRGGSGGGGGGGGSGKGGGASLLTGIPPVVDGIGALIDLSGGGKAPAGFTDLFRIDPSDPVALKWWNNNRNSMINAFGDKRSTWIYSDQRGNFTQLPFNPGMMSEMDSLHMSYMQVGLANASSVKEAQAWVGRMVTGANEQQSRGARYGMDYFDKTWASLELHKTQLLASGQIAEYLNTVQAQKDFARQMRDDYPYLTGDQRDQINTQLVKVGPLSTDPNSPTFGLGDRILQAVTDGTIAVQWFDSGQKYPDGSPVMAAGVAQIDPMKGYLTQGAFGIVALSDPFDPNTDFRPNPDNPDGPPVPRYYDTHVSGTVQSPLGGTVQVWQPVTAPSDQKLGKASPDGPVRGVQMYLQDAPTMRGRQSNRDGFVNLPQRATDGQGKAAFIPVWTMTTSELVNGIPRDVIWYSLTDPTKLDANNQKQGTWVRSAGPGGTVPRVVLGGNVGKGTAGQWQVDGKDKSYEEVLALGGARWWSLNDSKDKNGNFGAPGMQFVIRTVDSRGGLDWRPEQVIDAEEVARFSHDPRVRPPKAGLPSTPFDPSNPETARIRLDGSVGSSLSADTHSEAVRFGKAPTTVSTTPYKNTGGLPPVGSMTFRNPLQNAERFGLAPIEVKPRVIPPITPVAQAKVKTGPAPALRPIVIPKNADPRYANPMNAPLPIKPPPATVDSGGGVRSKAL